MPHKEHVITYYLLGEGEILDVNDFVEQKCIFYIMKSFVKKCIPSTWGISNDCWTFTPVIVPVSKGNCVTSLLSLLLFAADLWRLKLKADAQVKKFPNKVYNRTHKKDTKNKKNEANWKWLALE